MSKKHYGQMIKEKEMTPKEAGQSYVMSEIFMQVEEWKREGIENADEKKFVIAIAKIHNKLAESFVNHGGDAMPIEIDEIKVEI